jgi:1-acyl-sn-glycerol-3-phosphate acyltransferase
VSTARLFVDRRFWPLFWVQFLTAFNDNVLKWGMVLLVTYGAELYQEPVDLWGIDRGALNAIGGLLLMIPFMLFSATAGQLADKLPKHRIMRGVKAAEIGIMSIGAVGFTLAAAGMPEVAVLVLLPVVFLAGAQSTAFGPVKYSLIPQILPKPGELVAGNALVETGTYLSVLLGGVAAWALFVAPRGVGLPPTSGLYALAIGVVGFAVLGWLASLAQRPVPAEAPDLVINLEPFSSTWTILKTYAASPDLRFAMLANSWFWALGAAVLSVVPTWVERTLNADEATMTATQIVFSVGIGVGSLLCARLSRGRLELGLVVFGGLGITLGLLATWAFGDPWPDEGVRLGLASLAARPGAWVLAGSLFVVALAGGFFMVPLYAFLQHEGPAGERARVIGALNILNAVFIVVVLVAVAALLTFGVSELAILLGLALLNLLWVAACYRAMARAFLRILAELIVRVGWRARFEGLEHLPDDGPVLVISNHVSYVDFLILMATVRRPHRFVIWHAFTKLPVAGALTRQYQAIPVNNEEAERASLVGTFRQISAALRAGEAVVIFPEGGLPYEPGLQPFMRGLEIVLRRDPVPVVPVAINGLWGGPYSRAGGRAFSRFRLPRQRLWVTVGAPIAPDGQTVETLREAVADLYARRWENP